MIATSDKLSPAKRAELRGVISTKPGLARFLRMELEPPGAAVAVARELAGWCWSLAVMDA